MKRIMLAALITAFAVGSAMAQSCATKAVGRDGKPLAGAAKTSFMKKCCEDSAVSNSKRLRGTCAPADFFAPREPIRLNASHIQIDGNRAKPTSVRLGRAALRSNRDQ